MESDIALQDSTVNISGDLLKAAIVDVEVYSHGGHLVMKDGNAELSSDSGAVKISGGNLEIYFRGGRIVARDGAVEIGSQDGAKFKGISWSPAGVRCNAIGFMVYNPDLQPSDAQPRYALAQSSNDELLVNVNGHYAGGTRFDSAVTVKGDLVAQKTLTVPAGGNLLLGLPDQTVRLPNGKTARVPGQPIDVLQKIKALQDTVQQLQGSITQLQDSVAAMAH
ncbi:MAG: hypothetical protein WBW33_19185 [Bryobacteraceae bacterium]